jgi:hypothetical protein
MMQEPSRRLDLYRKAATEFSGLAKNATSPTLRSYYQRIAEDYLVRLDGELRSAERRGETASNARMSAGRKRTNCTN